MFISKPHAKRIRRKMEREGKAALSIEGLSLTESDIEALLEQIGIKAEKAPSDIYDDGTEWKSPNFSLTGHGVSGNRMTQVFFIGPSKIVDEIGKFLTGNDGK